MARFNSEFNYRYQVIGETPWAKIKTLQEFLGGRERAAAMERVSELKYRAKQAELENARSISALPHVLMTLEAELLEIEAHREIEEESFRQNEDEIACLKKLLAELFVIAEPSRIKGYSDDQMFEYNADNEFTAVVCKELQSELIANGRPSPAKLLNAMSNPTSLRAIIELGILPAGTPLIDATSNPLAIRFTPPPAPEPPTKKPRLQAIVARLGFSS